VETVAVEEVDKVEEAPAREEAGDKEEANDKAVVNDRVVGSVKVEVNDKVVNVKVVASVKVVTDRAAMAIAEVVAKYEEMVNVAQLATVKVAVHGRMAMEVVDIVATRALAVFEALKVCVRFHLHKPKLISSRSPRATWLERTRLGSRIRSWIWAPRTKQLERPRLGPRLR
jgi:predicted polyphosphate/ATP-dependent NAD kinase